MNSNDYEGIWKRQELPAGNAADVTDLKHSFETKRRKQAVALFARDLIEGLTGVFVSGVFAYVWWHLGRNGWPLVIAIALVLGVSAFFVRERLRARRARLEVSAALLAKIEADIVELRHQRRLLLNLWSWYLAPIAAAVVVVFITIARLLPPDFLSILRKSPAALAGIIGYGAVVLPLCFWGVWAMNRRAVRKQIEPRISELEKLRSELLASS